MDGDVGAEGVALLPPEVVVEVELAAHHRKHLEERHPGTVEHLISGLRRRRSIFSQKHCC